MKKKVDEVLPEFTVHGGTDTNGDPIYIARANHKGNQLPAKVIPNERKAFVTWDGEEYAKDYVEYLTGHQFGIREFVLLIHLSYQHTPF